MIKFKVRIGRRVGAVLAIAMVAIVITSFQNCSGFTAGTFGSGFSELSSLGIQTIGGNFRFASNFQAPASRQGTGEARMNMSDAEFDARYAKLKSWGAGYRQYNFWWSQVEDTGVTSTEQPQSCDGAHFLMPANEDERVRLGFHRYRCLNTSMVQNWDKLFSRDQANGMQSGIVMWSAPQIYRDARCEGFAFGGNHLMDGCVPRDNAMDDFEDYANFVASRYNGGAQGKISHYIVWNENDSSEWFDYTPNTSKTSTAPDQIAKRLDKLADMMKRVHAALSRHQQKAMMYVSTDPLWSGGLAAGSMGTQTLLQGMWDRLGLDYTWSVAVHPYGDVASPAPRGWYTFNNLEIVSQFQAQNLNARGVSDVASYPQYHLIASEQGWEERGGDRSNQARQICLAHAKVTSMPNLVAVAHNYFHSAEPQDSDASGSSNQGAFFGLIPYSIPNTLEGAENTITGQAFMSTMDTSKWNVTKDHYCCQQFQVGCGTQVTGEVRGNIDGVSADGVLTGWACAFNKEPSIPVHVYLNGSAGTGHIVTTGQADQTAEAAVAQACGTQGSAHRFSIPLSSDVRAQFANQTIFVHGISPTGGENKLIGNSGAFRVPANPAAVSASVVTSVPAQGAPDVASFPRTTLYRLYYSGPASAGDHLMTTSPSEGTPAYRLDGPAFAAISSDVNDGRLRPIYRCLYGTINHFVSTDANCEGFKSEGMLGKLLINQAPGSQPVYRFWNPRSGDHLATTNRAEADVNGFTFESVLGYAY